VLLQTKGRKLAPYINKQELSTVFKNSKKGYKGFLVALMNASFSMGDINIAAKDYNVPFCHECIFF